MNVAANNKILEVIISSLRAVALLCITGTLMQTFIETLNFDSSLNYLHTTLLQASNVSTIILCSRFADRGNIIKRIAIIQVPCGILFLLYIPLCIMKNASIEAYTLLLITGLAQSAILGLHTVYSYKMPYFIFHADEYGPITAVIGIISSLVSLGISFLFTKLTTYFEYKVIMLFAFLISALFMIISGILFSHQKSLIDIDSVQIQTNNSKKTSLLEVFKYPLFFKLLPANLFRGFASGVTTVLAIIAFDLGFNEQATSMMVTLQYIALLSGCTIFGFVSRYLSSRIAIFAGSLTFLLFPLMLIPNKSVFLISYTIIIFGRTMIEYGIPAVLIKVVPLKIAGPYNAWRMILHNTGTLTGTSLAAILSPNLLFIIAIITQLISGLYYILLKELRK